MASRAPDAERPTPDRVQHTVGDTDVMPAGLKTAMVLGILLLFAGLCFLFAAGDGEQSALLRRLAIGQACLVSGSVFLAAVLRPSPRR
jgi:hypothetical protein